MESNDEKLYPRLEKPSAPPNIENNYTNIDIDSNLYRLQHIKDIKNYLERNSDTRKSLSKRYSKINKGLHYTNYGLNTVSGLSSVATVSLLSTVILSPVSIILGGVSIGTSGLSIISSKLNKKFKDKETKHRDIYNLIENKLNLINSLLSKALEDNKISDEEFQLILKEEKHYRLHKEEIRRKNKKIFYDEESVKEQGKKELNDSLLEPINNLVNVIKKK